MWAAALCGKLVNSSACVYTKVWDEDCNTTKNAEDVGEATSNARKEPVAERGLGTVHSTQDSAVSKWPKATNLLIVLGMRFHLGVQCPVTHLRAAASLPKAVSLFFQHH